MFGNENKNNNNILTTINQFFNYNLCEGDRVIQSLNERFNN